MSSCRGTLPQRKGKRVLSGQPPPQHNTSMEVSMYAIKLDGTVQRLPAFEKQ